MTRSRSRDDHALDAPAPRDGITFGPRVLATDSVTRTGSPGRTRTDPEVVAA